MDENPYQSPQSHGRKVELSRPLSRRAQFLIGCAVLVPASWLLGRLLIPPDDVALRFSVTAWPALATLWGLFVWRQSLIGRNRDADDPRD